MKKKFSDTCLIEIKSGDKVRHIRDGRIGTVKDFKLTPNGRSDPRLIAVLSVHFILPKESVLVATAEKFEPIETEDYNESYPSDMLGS